MEQIKTFAVKVLGMTDEEVQSLYKKTDDGKQELNENFVDVLMQKDSERITRLEDGYKKKLTEIHDKGFQKAQKEVLGKFEKDVKEKYGFETDKMGIDLIDDLLSQAKSGSKEPQDIKTHPDYIKLERQLQTEFVPKTKLDEVVNEFDSFKTNVQKTKVISTVKEDARKVFRSLNPILSKDAKKAANQEAEFLSKLEAFDFQVQDDGNHVIIKDGSRLENEHKNPVQFSDFIKQNASMLYDFAEQPQKGSSGVDGAGSGSANAFFFKDYDEFKSKHKSETNREVRAQMFDAAKAQGIIK